MKRRTAMICCGFLLCYVFPQALVGDYRLIADDIGSSGFSVIDLIVQLVIFIVLMGWWAISVIEGKARLLLYAIIVGGIGAVLLEYSPNSFGQNLGSIFVSSVVLVAIAKYGFRKKNQ